MFDFHVSGGFDDYTNADRDAFWKDISGMDHFAPLMSPKNIVDGTWKYIRRLVSMDLFTRVDGGRSVQTKDLDVMITIKRGIQLDGYTYIGCLDNGAIFP